MSASVFDLSVELSRGKPKATKEWFDGIEQDSRDIDAADDSLIVQPVTNEDIRG